MTLAKIIARTIRESKLSAEELAEALGMSESAFYQAANPNPPKEGEKRPYFKPHQLLLLMELTRDYCILSALATALGFVMVKIPKARRMRPEDVIALQKIFFEFSQKLLDFSQEEISQAEALECAGRCLAKVAEAREMVKASDRKQPDLFDEE
jgi:DNA-binding transcriptional ArsR family regulator